MPFYFGDPSPAIKGPRVPVPGLQLGSESWTLPLPRGLFHARRSPIGLDNRHAATTRGRSIPCFGGCNLPIDARGAQFRIGWSRCRCTKGPGWVSIERSRANGDRPGSRPITRGGAHLKFSNRVFLRLLVQWDHSGGRRMRIWGSRLGWGRP